MFANLSKNAKRLLILGGVAVVLLVAGLIVYNIFFKPDYAATREAAEEFQVAYEDFHTTYNDRLNPTNISDIIYISTDVINNLRNQYDRLAHTYASLEESTGLRDGSLKESFREIRDSIESALPKYARQIETIEYFNSSIKNTRQLLEFDILYPSSALTDKDSVLDFIEKQFSYTLQEGNSLEESNKSIKQGFLRIATNILTGFDTFKCWPANLSECDTSGFFKLYNDQIDGILAMVSDEIEGVDDYLKNTFVDSDISILIEQFIEGVPRGDKNT